ncbi:rhodanese-like domain-containing protein [Roseofilum casamattae]|nr:rhodanese-like domain-containing protein [Roseofilum casamattae]
MTNPTITEMTVREFAQLSAEDKANWQLIDVREPDEIEVAALQGFEVFSLSEFAQWSEQIDSQLDTDKPTAVICHHGMRSQQMCQWLFDRGFTQLYNISGGIDAYSRLVDPSVPRY